MKQREKKLHGLAGSAYDTSPAADAERKKYKADLKAFFKDVWCHGNERHQKLYGRMHDYLIDFLRMDELPDLAPDLRHSHLAQYMPERIDGEYKERWIYWPVLDGPPEIQDGPDGPIADMFHDKQWAGVIARIVGDGRDKCVLLPRGHLKSAIATEAHTAWQIVRDPSARHLIVSLAQKLCFSLMGNIKAQFVVNDKFKQLFGILGPPEKEEGLPWAASLMQVRSKERRGKDPTLQLSSVGSDVTGAHVDFVTADDVVGEKNVGTKEQRDKTRAYLQNIESVRDPGSKFLDVGTIWSDDDAHREYIRRDGHSYPITSFIVGTVRQADDTPLWPEKFPEREIRRIENKFVHNRYFWFCQYWNQPLTAATRTFKVEWLKYYDQTPEELAREQHLNVVICCDPASSTKKKSDYSAVVAIGQAANGDRYLLDGIRDRLAPADLPKHLAKFVMKWQDITNAGGGSLRIGVELFSFAAYIKPPLENELRLHGRSAYIEELKHNYKDKADRISVLAHPFAMGSFYMPRSIKRMTAEGHEYDLIESVRDEYLRFSAHGTGLHDDLLDAMAYAEVFMRRVDGKPNESVTEAPRAHGIYARLDEPAQRGGRYFAKDGAGVDDGSMPERRVYGGSWQRNAAAARNGGRRW